MGPTGKDRAVLGDAADVKVIVDITVTFASILVLSVDL